VAASVGASRGKNWLLAALEPAEYRRIEPHLDRTPVKLRQILHKPGETVEYVYFPVDGFCSFLAVLSNGDMVEVASIGREGAVGISAASANARSGALTMVQNDSGPWLRMQARAYRAEIARGGTFHHLLTRFSHALLGFAMQSTACNAVHQIDQRLARWLLLAHDRVGEDKFVLTHDFLAMMLGASRPTVTIVAGRLQKAGLIQYRRGRITIVNRRGLQGASCECYRSVSQMLAAVTS
jgi:CRP-like cAMP-binding protein